MKLASKITAALAVASAIMATSASAACSDVDRGRLESLLKGVVSANVSGGLNFPMWLTFVDETGKVCSVVTSGATGRLAGNTQWLGSRVISAQKANTANAFSLDKFPISSGALYAAVQPGGSLFGLQESNPVDAKTAYDGNPNNYGTARDPLVDNRVGGVNVFGGGLAVYKAGKKVGAIGVSGDTSCTDHAVAWLVRTGLGLSGPDGAEKLTLKDEFAALGDHPSCINDSALKTPAGAVMGFALPK